MGNWNEQPEESGAGELGFKHALPFLLVIIISLAGVALIAGSYHTFSN